MTGIREGIAPAVAFLPDGRPLVGYWAADGALMLAECTDHACTDSRLAPFADIANFNLIVGADGSPIVVYKAPSAQEPAPDEEEFGPDRDLVIARCVRGTCVGG